MDFDRVHTELIAPAMAQCNLAGGTTGEVIDAGNIREDMFALIIEADLVICDITVHNANVFYELGVRHAMRKKRTVLLKGEPSADSTPFDLSTDRYLKYPVNHPGQAVEQLVSTLISTLLSTRDTDSPIFLLLPNLVEIDPTSIVRVPPDLTEDVGLAGAAGDTGKLRLIAEELHGERYQQAGLRLVGGAQWKLNDFIGAWETWEQVRALDRDDIEANFALANICERRYRQDHRETWLESSNQAIRRVLDSDRLTEANRAEALALQGRNLKTLWRLQLDGATDVADAQQRGLNRRLWEAFRSYRDAFDCDLNAFYPGINTLQVGHILLQLSNLPGWRRLFSTDARKAESEVAGLRADLPALAHVVERSIQRACKPKEGKDTLWAEISAVDAKFLREPEAAQAADPGEIVGAYLDTIPASNSFAWDAARGQLALFSQLGIRAEAAHAVIKAFEARPKSKPEPSTHLNIAS